MAQEGSAAQRAATAPAPDSPIKAEGPDDVTRRGWKLTFKYAVSEFQRDQCTDLAAALTYYSVLSVAPGLLALVSVLGVVGRGPAIVDEMLSMLRRLGQADVAKQLEGPLEGMVNSQAAGFTLVIGLATALFSASGYVGAFGRAMNRIYGIDEGRPIWKLRPVNILVTLGLVVMAAVVLVGLVVSGPLVDTIGNTIGLGQQAQTVWNVGKWPVILVVVMAMVAVLYYVTPNVRQPGFRWVSPGAALAILTWILASVGFGFYVGTFGKYDTTYGSLGGIIVFLLWLWLTNIALLLGAELDTELERVRELEAGMRAEKHLQLPPRDTRQSDKAKEKLEEQIEESRAIRRAAVSDTGSGGRRGGGRHRADGRAADASARASAGISGRAVDLEPLPSEEARVRGLP
ncbi:YihY/virulence factor BrkB family protein [Phycicoccus flavus]|uniref:YihY/virulence factor BrkB family protein n=1 Tax=Phycicoccus flavus TaxID=2502783 RepID=UPI00197C7F5F|nr:YihY/virulence factor BrkB family protein [Phycicoccus flavus]